MLRLMMVAVALFWVVSNTGCGEPGAEDRRPLELQIDLSEASLEKHPEVISVQATTRPTTSPRVSYKVHALWLTLDGKKYFGVEVTSSATGEVVALCVNRLEYGENSLRVRVRVEVTDSIPLEFANTGGWVLQTASMEEGAPIRHERYITMLAPGKHEFSLSKRLLHAE